MTPDHHAVSSGLDRHGEPARTLAIRDTVGVIVWTMAEVLAAGEADGAGMTPEKRHEMGRGLAGTVPPCHGCGTPLKGGHPINCGCGWICRRCGRVLCHQCFDAEAMCGDCLAAAEDTA